MKLWFTLILSVLSSISVDSKTMFSCSDQLDKVECLDIYYCGWCNASKFNVNSRGDVCKNIANCNISNGYKESCEYYNTINTCKVNTVTLYIFLLGLLIGCCYIMIVLVCNTLSLNTCSRTFPLLFFISPAIIILAIDEYLYIKFIFISIGIYLLSAMFIVYYTHLRR